MCGLQALAGLTSMLAADMHNYSIIQATANGGLRYVQQVALNVP